MKVSGPQHAVNINFTKISTKITQTLYLPIENVGPSSHSKRWLIRHSMASTVIYNSRDCSAIKHGEPSLDFRSVKKTSRCSLCFIPSKSLLLQWLFNLPLVAQCINFWLMHRLPMLG